MIGMFMSNENSAQCFRSSTDTLEAIPYLPAAETSIDQQSGITCLQKGAIAS